MAKKRKASSQTFSPGDRVEFNSQGHNSKYVFHGVVDCGPLIKGYYMVRDDGWERSRPVNADRLRRSVVSTMVMGGDAA